MISTNKKWILKLLNDFINNWIDEGREYTFKIRYWKIPKRDNSHHDNERYLITVFAKHWKIKVYTNIIEFKDYFEFNSKKDFIDWYKLYMKRRAYDIYINDWLIYTV